MTLDKRLLEDEFMHGFGHRIVGMRLHLYELNAATGNFDMIPDNVQERNHRKIYQDKYARQVLSPMKFYENLECFVSLYDELKLIANEQEKNSQQHSYLFELIQIFMDQIETAAKSFKQYLNETSPETTNINQFNLYKRELELAVQATNGVINTTEIYDSIVDCISAKEKWVEKHPDFSNGGWHPS